MTSYFKKEDILPAGKYDLTKQTDQAYHRQENVNAMVGNRKRYYKSIGLGFKTPKAAIIGDYIDKKCPFTGNVSIRGRIIRGIVHSTKMKKTMVIRRNYLHFVRKYQRYEKRHKNFTVHCSPCFDAKVGDEVTVGQCRPLSKTIRYNVLAVKPKGGAGKKFDKM